MHFKHTKVFFHKKKRKNEVSITGDWKMAILWNFLFGSQVEYCRFQGVYVLLNLCPLKSSSLAAQLWFSFLISSGLGFHSCEKEIKMENVFSLKLSSVYVTLQP